MTSNILCKYFMNGACAYGDQCRFSHNRQDESSQVCKYYLQGNCAYGDKCRYEHSKPAWSSRGQPPAPSNNYRPPPAVPKPPVGAAEIGRASSGNPNWDDYMTPDEMDEFEQWQAEQDMGQQGGQEDEFGDIMDPADIPLCSEYGATGQCSAGEDCLYIHGDMCEICGYYCVHPYNPDWTAQHQAACKEAMAAAAALAPAGAQGQQRPQQHQQRERQANGVAGAAADDTADDTAMESPAAAAAPAAAANGDDSTPEVKATVAAAIKAVVHGAAAGTGTAAADGVAEQLAATHISS